MGILIALYCKDEKDEIRFLKNEKPKKQLKDEVKIDKKAKSAKEKENPILGESNLDLIEKVEEFGFIPALNDIDNKRAS